MLTVTEEGILEKPAFDTIHEPHNPEPSNPAQLECDQHEFPAVQDHPSEPNGGELLIGSGDVLESSITCVSEDNGHLLDTEAPEKLKAGSDTCDLVEKKATQEDIKYREAKVGDKFENGLSNITTIPCNNLNGVGEKSNEGFPAEVSVNSNEALEPEAIPTTNSPKSHLEEVTETEDKLMVITDETRLIGKECENGDYKHDHNLSQSCEKLMKESKPDDSSTFQSELSVLEAKHQNCDQKDMVRSNNDSERKKEHVTEEAKVAENDDLSALCIDNQNGVSEEHCQDSKETAVVVSALQSVPVGLPITDCDDEKDLPTEKKIVDEKKESTKPLPDDQAEEPPCPPSISSSQSRDHKDESVPRVETLQSGKQSIEEPKQGNIIELLVEKVTTFNSPTNLIAEALVSVNEFGVDSPVKDVIQDIETPQMTASETRISTNQPTDQSAKVEASTFAISGSDTRESVERFSTDSDPDSLNVHAHMRKSPSFNLDLRSEEDRTEESDRTPLLYQDKAAIQNSPSQGDVTFGSAVTHFEHDQSDMSKYKAMPVQEKVVTLERSDSEKSRTPFLGFLKEEEEARIVVTPYKEEHHTSVKKAAKDMCKSPTKVITSSSPKVKEKRKARSSLFGTCICCATVIN